MSKKLFITLIIISIVFIIPIYWAAITSFKPSSEVLSYPPSLVAKQPTLAQFTKLFTAGDSIFTRYVINTFILCGLSIGMVLILSIMGGYSLSKLPFKGSNIIFLVILSIMMVPYQSLLIPLYNLMNAMGLLDSLFGVSLIYTTYAMPFCIFMMKNYFSSLPNTLRESALIDGASEIRILFGVHLPLALPAIATVIVYVFLMTWNDFILALNFTSSNDVRNIQVGITLFATTRFTRDWGLINAGATFSIIPSILVFLLLQKYYVEGMTAGTNKE
ncbi:carbohydrate ABC transporter permease [Mesotoga sp. BH458_6_3_2_1]|uniref:carbohydrate ABC transporter permease n=1 Tax=Mesotoga sp. BH458_6_3_2_1 TaxID=1437446 RepID=UPI000EF29137|nr:carbohydrate ABC transporter permease [Mesotoga sp. BH458_6_3_2_1]RLL83047.1 ABC transporter permease [Mesotoga sp. BH458_6_3_2_1]